ncbi:hypothetical protein [Psychroflexus sp. ALD_RP9]|uniref:hypothetical protein n=1 Tax=Psychroflexus sp. ALD_RP9 TaxID=2777186 RepID=UPI001A8E4664|nr:hypothetical protein [Psychroflexus sp. ALD_RP9]QSS96606.1 hypothetical protein IMZ30_09150 [Psychroflexus sp. ALD_RP9]
MAEITFEETVKRVNRINSRLRSRHFTPAEIDAFWSKLIHLIPKIKENKDSLKICTGCGKLNIEEIPKQYIGCCPDSTYIDVEPKKIKS